jgi:pSer/pThr/pTyr-binding forkhead associated (FHA) protein
MRKPTEQPIKPGQPALIVTHGTTKNKVRPLVREIMVIGRTPGCDIGLMSPDVAPVHCVIVRQPTGWLIRDCSGRATRVNGQSITEATLRDGDIIQVGTFSFQAELPTIPPAPQLAAPAAQAQIARLDKARRRITERALRLRSQLRERDADGQDLARQRNDLERLEQRVKNAREGQQSQKAEQDKRKEELDAYSRHLRREVQKCREHERELEAELVRQHVQIKEERLQMQKLQSEMQARFDGLEAAAMQLTDALAHERQELHELREEQRREREHLTREREYLAQQRQELIQERGRTEEPSTRETKFDAQPPDRLESARRLLRELAERRQHAAK